MGDYSQERQAMVRHQLEQQGIRDPRVLEAMERIPRHRFLPEEAWEKAYRPQAVDIEAGQTMSQPYMVAIMTEALELTGRERVLEVGTGSGYQAAVLAYLADEVVTIERIGELAQRARERAPLRARTAAGRCFSIPIPRIASWTGWKNHLSAPPCRMK